MESKNYMEEIATRFNQQSKSDLLLLKKCYELKEEKHYFVYNFKKVETAVGDALLVSLSDTPYKDGEVAKFKVYLPKRFVILLQNEDLDSIAPGTFYLTSHGKCGNNSVELSLHLVNNL